MKDGYVGFVKTCPNCKRELPIRAFYESDISREERSWCKDCMREEDMYRDRARIIGEAPTADLVGELKRRGYTGILRLRKENTIEVMEE